ncbi:MAG: aldo/keto reductase [Candidatus Thiodiazotropha sp. (ex Myrtea sp. 'scaly one' KF741663)]|nr:aldo/keto reductase [Candidatus Thiodiazotropha sp. (ex Myrtea sp. 'scaly one' KF741663)]
MKGSECTLSRRRFLQQITGLAGLISLPAMGFSQHEILKRQIPASGELIPILGMGTWQTFDVANYPELVQRRSQVLKAFFELGGGMIDSSPMYGSSEQAVGACLERLNHHGSLFTATKVWTPMRWLGIQQMKQSMKLWGLKQFDLMQIHNMLDWETHLETLKAWKAEGKIRYIGITTSHGRRHEALEQALISEDFDFVQLTYNLLDREAEQRLLPLAAERGIAVIVNRPFRRGELFDLLEGKPLPAWAAEIDCANWAQFFLKFILSHPSVTCAIPATSRVDHMHENMGAGVGVLPDPSTRRRMVDFMETI